jgi:hypothetical protein
MGKRLGLFVFRLVNINITQVLRYMVYVKWTKVQGHRVVITSINWFQTISAAVP